MLGVFEDVRCGLVERDRTGPGSRVRHLSCVEGGRAQPELFVSHVISSILLLSEFFRYPGEG